MDILQEARDLGLTIDNYCSDLYIKVSPDSAELIERYEFKQNVTTFWSEIAGEGRYYDVPFAYTDYYKK